MIGIDVRDQLQAACERGQEQLIDTQYLAAAATLAAAEATAWEGQDFDTLARLYMPLQEARRQIRLRCGEGAVDCVLAGPTTTADEILGRYPQGQLIIFGNGSVAIAAAVRQRAAERGLYVEALLAALFRSAATPAWCPTPIVIVPTADADLPGIDPSRSFADLERSIPPGCFVPATDDLPRYAARGTPVTFATMSALWERLHAPYLAAAEAEPDPLRRMAAFRKTIAVDPACELAHQHLSNTARDLARQLARGRA